MLTGAAAFALAPGCSHVGDLPVPNDEGLRSTVAASVVIRIDDAAEAADSGSSTPLCERTDPAKFGEGVAWAADFEEAMERGKRENKPVLVAFSALRQEPGRGDNHEY